jgi:predicted DCC family thiol-disulfide oxidoreductase YuxK
MVTDSVCNVVREAPPLTVLYDGACPLCRREIGVYRGLQPLQADMPVCFVDVSDASLSLPPGTSRAQLLARFHVRGRDGELLSGAQAFLALWAALPGWRWLARAGRVPGAAWVMERSYRLFLRWRPSLQRWAVRLDKGGRPTPRKPHRPDPADPHDDASR